MGRRIEIGPDQSLGRRCLLDLGDQAIAIGSLAIERGPESAWRGLVARQRFQFGERNRGFALRDIAALRVANSR